ncbi:MAG: CehA/McbA family metallohydrolase [Spirochaetaceae bacterium]|nr:CehA/McbA family metallohydrolase [Spirochaetaceae bacterium]
MITRLTLGTTADIAVQIPSQVSDPYRYVPFHVPAGTTRLDVTCETECRGRAYIDLGLFDPSATAFPTRSGFRGWSGSARNRFHVATDSSTPGYVAGAVPGGTWRIILGCYVIPDGGATVRLTVRASERSEPHSKSDGARATCGPPEQPDPVRRGAGWYRGDLHAHTFHSDAEGSPQVLHRLASALGLDYLAVTDHNTVTAWDYFTAASSPELVFVPGVEITTYRGHANVLGVRDWIDFRIRTEDDLTQLAAEVRRRNALLSVNHDKPPMRWTLPEPDMACMEVWQRHWWTGNEASLARFDARIRQGRRITLIGGSDYHTPARPLAEDPFGLGCPTTVVWLEELSIAALIAGLARGCVYVTESPRGPHLEIRAHGVPMGGVVRAPNRLVVDVDVRGAAGDILLLVGPDGPVAETVIDATHFALEVPGARGFVRAEIIAAASAARLEAAHQHWCNAHEPPPRAIERGTASPQRLVRALSNPIYLS